MRKFRLIGLHLIGAASVLGLQAPTPIATYPLPSHKSNAYVPQQSYTTTTILNTVARSELENNDDINTEMMIQQSNKIAISPQGSVAGGSFIKAFNEQLQRRIAADPRFVSKSFVEVGLAIGTHFIAEVGRRGGHRMLPEIDFVVAGILTSVAGKYYSMWRVAPTQLDNDEVHTDKETLSPEKVNSYSKATSFWSRVPTNAFQATCPDGLGGMSTVPPSIELRIAAFIKPIPTLFRAGAIASGLGYGMTSILIYLRSILIPAYQAQTKMVNIPFACIYTGCFMAVVSNIRYQLLSGVIEPKFIDRYFEHLPPVHKVLIFMVRFANGILGSMLAISGMKFFGLQKLK